MTDSTDVISLITCGVATAAALLQMERACQRHPDMDLEVPVEVKLAGLKSELRTYAHMLSRHAMSVTWEEIEAALLSAPFDPSLEPASAWTALIEKLSGTGDSMDQAMAKALRAFA